MTFGLSASLTKKMQAADYGLRQAIAVRCGGGYEREELGDKS